jgi:hypothetical protein
MDALVYNALAVFTLTLFLRDMDGPGDMFVVIRFYIKAVTRLPYPDGTSEFVWNETTFFGNLFACFWCLSTWVAAIVSIASCAAFGLPWWYWLWLIASSIAVAGFMYKVMNRG